MNTTTPDYLRLYRERAPEAASADRSLLVELEDAFQQVTGAALDEILAAVAEPAESTGPLAPRDQAVRRLGALVGQMWDELEQTRAALRRGEAELATSVPLVASRRDGEHLAARLESVLRGGTEAIGCDAAALYALDSATTQLKLRTSWNLPMQRLADPPRPLPGAVADLEAMCGHAVVLDDQASMNYWSVPESCAAAVCVPVSSATMILGTLWVYSHQARSFTDQEVSMLEIVAGRMAAELERELLLAKEAETVKLEKQLELAARIQQQQLPQSAPLCDDWQVAGTTDQLQMLGGDFHDWMVDDQERLLLAVADCLDGGVDASLCAAGVRATWRAVADDVRGPEEVLARINRQLWTGSAGDQYAHLFVAFAEPRSGRLSYSAAGSPAALLLDHPRWQSLLPPSLALGVDIERVFESRELILSPGNSLVVLTNGVLDALDEQGRPLDIEQLAEWLLRHPSASAGQLVDLVRDFLEAHYNGRRYDDRTILALRRR